jgi:hypothetical protein
MDSSAADTSSKEIPVKYTKDSVVNCVIAKFIERSNVGIEKYGTTLDRDDLSVILWATHMQEELMDGILYLEKWKRETAAAASLLPVVDVIKK